MRLLLDTHALIWWLTEPNKLGPESGRRLTSRVDDVFASAASAWELHTKYRIGKLPHARYIVERGLGLIINEEGFHPLPISFEAGTLAGSLVHDHKDPFDRMLIAQAKLGGLTLVSNETLFDGFGVERLW